VKRDESILIDYDHFGCVQQCVHVGVHVEQGGLRYHADQPRGQEQAEAFGLGTRGQYFGQGHGEGNDAQPVQLLGDALGDEALPDAASKTSCPLGMTANA